QSEVLGVVNRVSGPRDVVVCAAGSMPGDLHKLWRTRDPKGYHVEYGYSCMGYEVAGAIGVKMAAPEREVYAMVGDGSWLMMSSDLVTALQEGVKITIILIDNGGFGSIGGLSTSVGSEAFGTKYRYRGSDGQLSGDRIRVDFAANARSLGAHVIPCRTVADLKAGLVQARAESRVTVLTIETDPAIGVGGYESWWDVPPAEVSESEKVKAVRRAYEEAIHKERWFL
ncbi:MAG TPA: thiamine pyrophosphate-dependent enzyme, partial [Vicinamibacteria bacterium]|nr:thiamine pyrophosphate-dependent enzyme [Vicinamibacteria bacterium]